MKPNEYTAVEDNGYMPDDAGFSIEQGFVTVQRDKVRRATVTVEFSRDNGLHWESDLTVTLSPGEDFKSFTIKQPTRVRVAISNYRLPFCLRMGVSL